MISNTHRFICFCMHKNASSSLRKALDQYCYKKLGDHINVAHAHKNMVKHKMSRWDVYYKFSFVRNPFDRMVSWYTYTIRSFNKYRRPKQKYLYTSDNLQEDFYLYLLDHEKLSSPAQS